jgi:hypothetical protein
LRTVALAAGCLLGLVGGIAFLFAGIYELAAGNRPPGVLGWDLIRSRGSTQAMWSATRWRRNGVQVVVMGFGLLVLALWAAVGLLNLR